MGLSSMYERTDITGKLMMDKSKTYKKLKQQKHNFDFQKAGKE